MKSTTTVKKNYEFRRMYAKGKSGVSSCLVVYYRKNRLGHNRLGVTVSTKLGHAVVRNRSKRRLRALCAEILPQYAVAGADYNFIARAATPNADFESLRADAAAALKRLRSDLTTVRENADERA